MLTKESEEFSKKLDQDLPVLRRLAAGQVMLALPACQALTLKKIDEKEARVFVPLVESLTKQCKIDAVTPHEVLSYIFPACLAKFSFRSIKTSSSTTVCFQSSSTHWIRRINRKRFDSSLFGLFSHCPVM